MYLSIQSNKMNVIEKIKQSSGCSGLFLMKAETGKLCGRKMMTDRDEDNRQPERERMLIN